MRKIYIILGVALFTAACAKVPTTDIQKVEEPVIDVPIAEPEKNTVTFSAKFAEEPAGLVKGRGCYFHPLERRFNHCCRVIKRGNNFFQRKC